MFDNCVCAGNNYPFLTLKERDIETGLDYFKARYYSSAQGRFTSPDAPFADQRQTDPSSWNSYAYVRNNPCNRTDPDGRCSPPSGLKPGQVGICIEAFIAAKTIEKFGMKAHGDGRTFSGTDDTLSAKFRTQIIAENTPGNSKTFDIAQKTKAAMSVAENPLYPIKGPPLLTAQGTAETRLNGQASNADGSSKVTTPIGGDGVVRFNVSTVAENGFQTTMPLNLVGQIKTSLDLTINTNTGQVGLEGSSSATGYPSLAVYRYVTDGKNTVTIKIIEQGEGSPSALKDPMKPLPEVKPR